MRIKLIAPANKESNDFWGARHLDRIVGVKLANMPLALPTLAALTPKDVEVEIVDENFDEINFDENIDLVGITFLTYLAPRAYEIADRFRIRGVKVVLGGIHTSMVPDEAKQHADSIVIGEAEDIWPKLINDLRNNKLQNIYRQKEFPSLQSTPIPRWDLIDTNKYSYSTIQIGRGCPHGCEFCSVYIFNGRRYRYKPIDNVIKEVKYLRSINPKQLIFFVDDNLLAMPDYARELFNKLIPLKVRWWCQSSVDRLQDDEIIELMYKAGCREIFIGFESISEQSLDNMGKTKTNIVQNYERTIKRIHHHHISVFGSFIFGAGTDDKNIFQDTYNFIQRNNIAFSMLNILTPLPGTLMYKRFNEEKRIIDFHWSKYNVENVCYKPKLMTVDELQEGRYSLLKEVYSYKNMYLRLKKLWNYGIYVREKERRKLFTKGRILFTLRVILRNPFNIKRNLFILKCLWNSKIVSISPIMLAVNFHEYANNYRIGKKC